MDVVSLHILLHETKPEVFPSARTKINKEQHKNNIDASRELLLLLSFSLRGPTSVLCAVCNDVLVGTDCDCNGDTQMFFLKKEKKMALVYSENTLELP